MTEETAVPAAGGESPARQLLADRRAQAGGGIVLLLVLFLFWRGCHKSTAGEGDTKVVVSVQVAKAERAPISNEITTVATLSARREATIMPKISGQIAQMALVKNRPVREGDVIALLESRDLAAQRAEAAAALEEANTSAHETVNGAIPLTNVQDEKAVRDARVALENARKTSERRQLLFDEGGISKKELEASKQALINAENDLHVAETSASVHRGTTNPGDVAIAQSKARQASDHLANLDAQLGYSVIRAPFAGTVTEQFQYQGDFANPGSKLVTVADASSLIAKVQVGEATAAKLKVGDAVSVFPDELPGVAVAGKIDLVGRGADAQSRSVEVWISVPNPAGRLRPNGVARVVIASESIPDAIVVPSSAVTLDATNGNSGTVMVVDAKSIAHEVHVTIGRKSGGRTQITSGLQNGKLVVIEGNYGLPDGTEVAVPKAEAPKAEVADPAK
ncbi:MAG TPA: efflux RND transporter periplasmic adaptor subunit [Thermoanaerobaculia bacterium]|nr:efflux RND transporter periplasmic adaptor subunit [Thermoanaerobaculia bacterium]